MEKLTVYEILMKLSTDVDIIIINDTITGESEKLSFCDSRKKYGDKCLEEIRFVDKETVELDVR